MRVKVKNDQMISGQWLKPGEVVMIPNNKAVKEYEDLGIAEVVKWRTRKVPDVQKVGPTENTALRPERETMTISKSEAGSLEEVLFGSKNAKKPEPKKRR
jgi:hypothetical protein